LDYLAPELARAAAHYGIEPEYTDTWGHRHTPSEEAVRRILSALGVPDGMVGETERFLHRETEALETQPLDPTLVVRDDATSIALRIPAERAGASVKLEIQWEGGDIQHLWMWLPEVPTTRQTSVDGREILEKSFPLPQPLRLGYHRILVYWMKEPELEVFGEASFIVCPPRAHEFDGRAAGVALSLFGLRSARNWGCGDTTDLRRAIDTLAPAGAAFVALNPLHAIANRQPYNTSPYLPQSSLYRNFLYLDVERVPGFAPVSAETAAEIAALRASEFVEYERVAKVKLAVLAAAFERFQGSGGDAEFDAYAASEGAALDRFAIYCALDEEMHRRDANVWVWTDWPLEYRDPGSPEVAAFAREHSTRVLFFKFLQWQLDRQLREVQAHALERGMKIGLYHDLALATDRFGADVWAYRSFYVQGCHVGAPPDEFAPGGQDWGFPPPDGQAHRANGYELFARSLRDSARHGGALRIDHVMRFFRLYWIPDGLPASEGAYVRDFAEDLLGILALESVRNGFIVIGEDLGTVTGEVRRRLIEGGILGYRVLWFEKNKDGSFREPSGYTPEAAVSTTTHDLPTLNGFFAGRDIEARLAAGLIDHATFEQQWDNRHHEVELLHQALSAAGFPDDPVGFVLSTPCRLAIINQEDLTREPEQQNLPASTSQYPNWRRKMRVPVEELGGLAARLREKIRKSGR
jgi:4-alpha-glucanotransferase